jgi:hypothetical protein
MDAETRRVMKEALARMGTWTERDTAELEASLKLGGRFLARMLLGLPERSVEGAPRQEGS